MKKKLVLTLMLVLGIFVFAGYAHADDSSVATPAVNNLTVSVDPTSAVTVSIDPVQDLTNQIATLQLQEQDPTVSNFSKFFIHLKIRNLENKLNLQEALQ